MHRERLPQLTGAPQKIAAAAEVGWLGFAVRSGKVVLLDSASTFTENQFA